MKKTFIAILVLSLLLAILTACGAQAKQPDEPEPAQQADQIEPAEPEQSAEPAPQALEPIADIKPTTEPETVADVEPEPEPIPENTWTFTDCNEAVYATNTVNLRSGPNTDYEKIGSLAAGDSVTRTGKGTGDYSSWSRVMLNNGDIVYVSSNYISTSKPEVQQATKPTTGTTSKTETQQATKPSESQSSGNSGTSSDAGQQWAEANGQGLAAMLEHQSKVQFEEGAEEGRYNDPSVRVNMS